MCGIIITQDLNRIPLIKHRGIESNYTKGPKFYYGHHRLPILTEIGDQDGQPVLLKNGGILLYNGEIFNYPTQYRSDVHYIADLLESDDFSGLIREAQNWDGFWAIVYVSPSEMVHCFTDPLGKKQLYYNELGEICSEIRPLLRGHKFDEVFKSSVYKWGYHIGERTPWEGIKRIIPNRGYSFNRHGRLLFSTPFDYFSWRQTSYRPLRDLLTESVERRLASKNYPIGMLLSGGLDSSIIASILTDLGAKVQFYTVENGETDYAEIMADYLGADLKYLKYDPETDVQEILKWNESPVDLGSMVPQHQLMSIIPEKIVLTGDGADELFGGYRRAKQYDSQKSDVFEELPYYHLPRLDRASMRYTIELRSPFLGHEVVKYALDQPYEVRTDKQLLKSAFKNDLPDVIINREKKPLKNDVLVRDSVYWKNLLFDHFYNKIEF